MHAIRFAQGLNENVKSRMISSRNRKEASLNVVSASCKLQQSHLTCTIDHLLKAALLQISTHSFCIYT